MYYELSQIRFFPDTKDLIHCLQNYYLDKPCIISFCNAHAINLAKRDAEFRANLLASDFLLRDGSGIKIAMKLLGLPPGANLNGTDIIPLILDKLPRARLALYGTQEPWLGIAAKEFGKKHEIVAILDGYRPIEAYVQAVKQNGPEIILLGMGMPKQEKVARLLAKCLYQRCFIINGGAIIDFAAHRFNRAPLWIRWIGMEWFYRLIKEPKRLFSRYIIGNFVFLWDLGICFFHQKNKKQRNFVL